MGVGVGVEMGVQMGVEMGVEVGVEMGVGGWPNVSKNATVREKKSSPPRAENSVHHSNVPRTARRALE